MKKQKIAVVMASVAMALMLFLLQNLASAASEIVDQKTAEKMALLDTKHIHSIAKVLYTDIVYDYNTDTPVSYIVVIAVDEKFLGYSKADIQTLFEQGENDRSIRPILRDGIRSVGVSATKDMYPLPGAGSNVPLHTGRRKEILGRAAQKMGIPAENLIDGRLVSIYGKGAFQEVKSAEGKKRVYVEWINLSVLDDNEMAAAMVQGREKQAKEKDERIRRFRDDWERYERRIREATDISSL
jgi:hypothetical protein